MSDHDATAKTANNATIPFMVTERLNLFDCSVVPRGFESNQLYNNLPFILALCTQIRVV